MKRNRGKKKPTLRDISREPFTDADDDAMIEALQGASAIEAAVVGLAMVERELDSLIRGRLRHKDDSTYEMLTGAAGPLSTFSQKVDLGYAFGFYDDQVRDNLSLIRRVRNVFAHPPKLVSFEHPAVLREFSRIAVRDKARNKIDGFLRTAKNPNSGEPGANRHAYLSIALQTILMKKKNSLLKASLNSFKHRQKKKAKPPSRSSLGALAASMASKA